MAKICPLILLTFCVFATTAALHRRSQGRRELRQFNAGQDSFYNTNGNGGGTSYGGKRCENPTDDDIENGRVQCTTSGCRVKCHRGFKMDDTRTLYLTCDQTSGIMNYQDRPWKETLPPCLPSCAKGCPEGQECVAPNKCESPTSECDPPCQNGGTCIIPGVCNCAQGYAGLLCEQHRCAIPNKAFAQATVGADSELTMMDIVCNDGLKFEDGQAVQYFTCHHHQWLTKDRKPFSDVDIDCYA